MNAFEHVKNLTMITKVEAVVYLFTSSFSECFANLKPWVKNDQSEHFNDPDSIDIGFDFPDSNFACRCGYILMQVRIHRYSPQEEYKAVGIQLSGYQANLRQWKLSTIGSWEFSGRFQPTLPAQTLLKQICREILQLFDDSQTI